MATINLVKIVDITKHKWEIIGLFQILQKQKSVRRKNEKYWSIPQTYYNVTYTIKPDSNVSNEINYLIWLLVYLETLMGAGGGL